MVLSRRKQDFLLLINVILNWLNWSANSDMKFVMTQVSFMKRFTIILGTYSLNLIWVGDCLPVDSKSWPLQNFHLHTQAQITRADCFAHARCAVITAVYLTPFATVTDDVTKQGGPLRKWGYGYDVSRRPCSDYSSIRIFMYVHYQLLKSPWLIRAILSCERTLWRKCQLRYLIMFILTHNFNQ